MSNGTPTPQDGRGPTLDGLFRRAAVRNPDALALIDPDNRSWFTDGEPLHLTFTQADRIVWAIAARLHALGLHSNDVVAVQLPNTVESVLTFLGILRAGMVAALLPMLWRENEIVAALCGIGAKALITTARIGETDHCEIAMKAAAQLFSIRHVCAYGQNLPDGVTPFDDLLTTRGFDLLATGAHSGDPSARPAVITFEPSARGIAVVPRTNLQVIAGGVHVVAAAALQADMALLSATPVSSFAGLCATLMPPLLTGGRLVLHQPFDVALFADMQVKHQCETVVLPAPLIQDFIDRGLVIETTKKIIVLWRSPERAETARPLDGARTLTDLRIFGETALAATPRTADGKVTPLAAGMIGDALELKRTDSGTLAVRGAMVGRPEAGNGPDPFVDTGYPCHAEPNGRLTISGPRAGMIGVGGYIIARSDLDALTMILGANEQVTALPDPLLGQRLAASSSNRDDAERLLSERGANPLITGAFRPRRAA